MGKLRKQESILKETTSKNGTVKKVIQGATKKENTKYTKSIGFRAIPEEAQLFEDYIRAVQFNDTSYKPNQFYNDCVMSYIKTHPLNSSDKEIFDKIHQSDDKQAIFKEWELLENR